MSAEVILTAGMIGKGKGTVVPVLKYHIIKIYPMHN
jgi:dephospho-CoA kinase